MTLTFQTRTAGQSVHITGQVALPDGAVLDLGLTRAILDPDRADEGPGYLSVDSATTTVTDGRFTAVLIDNRRMNASEYVAVYNEGEPPARQMSVGSTVEVSVSFSPQTKGQTPDAVAAAGGQSGSSLQTSPQAHKIGGSTDNPYWTLSALKEFDLPIT